MLTTIPTFKKKKSFGGPILEIRWGGFPSKKGARIYPKKKEKRGQMPGRLKSYLLKAPLHRQGGSSGERPVSIIIVEDGENRQKTY